MSLGKKMFNGMAWSAIERLSVQGVQFILGIILARILTPKEYGTIGILLVFIALSNVFIDSGFTKALIQKQNRTTSDISTVFWFNILISLSCYVILFFIAPFVSDFYEIPLLTSLLRVLAISLIIKSMFAIPMTILTIELDFKSITKVNLIAALLSGTVAIYMAYLGYGVWALVIQNLVHSISTTIFIWYWVRWKPSFVFSSKSLKELFAYGSNLLISSLLNVSVNNFYALFIAKLVSTKDLGYYTRGTQFATMAQAIVSSVLNSVLLPALSTVQDQREILVKHTRLVIKATAVLITPLFIFLAVIAEPLIRVLLTEKWMPAVPIMQIFCIARLITLISGINVNLLYVIGRTDLALKQQYLKLAIRVVFLIAALKYGIIYIALAELVSTIIHFFINTYFPGKIMKYGAFSQLRDLSLTILAALLMAIIVYLSIFYLENDILKLCISPVVALLSYFSLVYVFKIEEVQLILKNSKDFIKKK